MFANSVISRSSISISSLLLSSLRSPSPPPPRPLPFLTRSLFAYNLASSSMSCRLVSSSRLGFARAASAIYKQVVVMRCRVTSGLSALVPSLFLPSIVRPSRLSHLCPPRLSFIYRAARVSLFLALLFIDLPGEFAFTRHRSKRLALAPSLSLSLLLFAKTGPLRRRPIRSLSFRLFFPGK